MYYGIDDDLLEKLEAENETELYAQAYYEEYGYEEDDE